MQDVPCTLIVDDDENSLGDVALRLLRLRIDVFYAKGGREAWLLAQQEANRIQTVVFPPSVDFEEIARVVDCLRSHALGAPLSLVVIGPRADEAVRERLRAGGVEWALWEPFDESALRSIVSAATAPPYEGAQRRESRLPTMLLGRIFVGIRRKDAIVATLSMSGAFLETPSPLPEESPIALEISLPDGTLLVKGRVACAHHSNREAPHHPSGMGVEFAQLSPEAEERLSRFLSEIEDRFAL
jgi:hypothetical protein